MHVIGDSRGVSELGVSNWNPYVGIADLWETLARWKPFKHTDYADTRYSRRKRTRGVLLD